MSIALSPQSSSEIMLRSCLNQAREVCLWLHLNNTLFENNDRIQIIIGYDESVKKSNRQIIKGWIPAKSLNEIDSTLNPLEYSNLGGFGSVITNGWEKEVYQ